MTACSTMSRLVAASRWHSVLIGSATDSIYEFVNFANDALFQGGFPGATSGLVAAFQENTAARDVTGVDVRIARHPDGGAVGACEFAFQSQRVIHNHFSAQSNDREIMAELNDLYRVRKVGAVRRGELQIHGFQRAAERTVYGALMPLGQDPLTNGELSFIEQWMLEGAPETGVVADIALLEDTSIFAPHTFEPLPVPQNGIQLHVGPFDIWPAERYDRELYYFEPVQADEPMPGCC